LDASTIDLTLSLFPWAKFRATKGAVKLHAMIDLRGNIPAFLYITDGKSMMSRQHLKFKLSRKVFIWSTEGMSISHGSGPLRKPMPFLLPV
jgi:hypothetical protein